MLLSLEGGELVLVRKSSKRRHSCAVRRALCSCQVSQDVNPWLSCPEVLLRYRLVLLLQSLQQQLRPPRASAPLIAPVSTGPNCPHLPQAAVNGCQERTEENQRAACMERDERSGKADERPAKQTSLGEGCASGKRP